MAVGTTQAAGTTLVVTPHPLTTRGQVLAVLQPGRDTLAQVLAPYEVDAGWVVEVGGIEVPAIMWQRMRVKPGQVIEARRPVHKDAVRIVALIALAVYAPQLAVSMGFTAGSVSAAIATAAIVATGTAVINRVLPVNANSSVNRSTPDVAPTYNLAGGRNQARQYQPLALVLGQPYVVPDLASLPYSHFDSEDQYLTQIFHAGINCASVSEVSIGQTPVTDYSDVSLYYDGFTGHANTSMPSGNVDSLAGGLLDAPSGTGPYVQRTSSPGTVRLVIDIEANLFAINSTSGAFEARTVALDVEYRATGTTSWTTWPGLASLTNASSKPLRTSSAISVASGQYDVRLRKLTANLTSSNEQNVVSFVLLKSYQADTASYAGQSRLGIVIKASGQLSGSLDTVNWRALAKPMPYWNGSAWVTATTPANGLSNPGAQMLQLMRGIYDENNRLIAGLGWPDSRIDIDSLKRFMVWCAGKNFTFDAVIQEPKFNGDLLGAIAAAGLGSLAWPDGRIGVTWLADDAPICGVINMGNIKAKSFSVTYPTAERADEIELSFVDSTRNWQWQAVRVQAPGVTTPANTSRMNMLGITREAHAALLARHSMGQNIFMAKEITFDMDLEYLTFHQNSVVSLSHDMTQWGYSGRVQAASNAGGTVTLQLDDAVPAGASRFVGLRLLGETQVRVFAVNTFSGTTRSITLSTAWPSGVALPAAHEALWIYDFKAVPGLRCVVTRIEPASNQGGARVSLSPLPTEFWPYVLNGSYSPPPSGSLLPSRPAVSGARVTEELIRQGNTFAVRLAISYTITGSSASVQVWGARDGAPLALLGSSLTASFEFTAPDSGAWQFELRAFDGLGRGTAQAISYTVVGKTAPPADVATFSINGNTLTWPTVGDVDLAGYLIRFQYGQNTWWPTAAPLHEGVITDSPYTPATLPAGTVTLMVKAVDTSGNESVNAASITVNLGDALVENLVLTAAQAPSFTGTITGGSVSGGHLLATATDFFYGPDDEPFYGPDTEPFYPASTYSEMVYEFAVTTAATGRVLLQSDIDYAHAIEYQRGDQSQFYGEGGDFFYGPDADYFYGDPTTGWTLWPGQLDMTAAEELRFRVSTTGGGTRGVVRTLTVLQDVPDVFESLNDITISAAGTRLPLLKSYTAINNVQITVQANGAGGVTVRVLDKSTTGPLVEVLNAAGTAVAGSVDARVQGYLA